MTLKITGARRRSGRRAIRVLAIALAAVVAPAALVAPAAAGASDAAAPASTAGGTIEQGTYHSLLGDYPYLAYVPATVDPSPPAPVVVVLHGCNETDQQMMDATGYNAVADEHHFIVVYPGSGPTDPVGCYTFMLPTSQERGLGGDADAIAGITEQVMQTHDVDPQRVYAIGFSGGGFMVPVLVAAYPDLFAAAGVSSGGAWDDLECLANVGGTAEGDYLPITYPLVTPVSWYAAAAYQHEGDYARVVPVFGSGGTDEKLLACTKRAVEQSIDTNNLVLSGADDQPLTTVPAQVTSGVAPGPAGRSYETFSYRTEQGCEYAELWSVDGMQHEWSGGSSDPSLAAYSDPTGPDESEASWRFFAQFTLSNTDSLASRRCD